MRDDRQLPMEEFVSLDQFAGKEVISDRTSILIFPGAKPAYELRYQKIMKKLWDAYFIVEPQSLQLPYNGQGLISGCPIEELINRFDLTVKQAYPKVEFVSYRDQITRRELFDVFNRMIVLVKLRQGLMSADQEFCTTGVYITITDDKIERVAGRADLKKLMK